MKLLVKTLHGLETVLAAELEHLGAGDIEVQTRAVSCSGDQKVAYQINYLARTALSVLLPLAEAQVTNEQELYEFVYQIDWYDYFAIEKSFVIDVACFSDVFRNSLYVAQKCKDAIADKFRSKYNRRPSVRKDSDVKINVYINAQKCILSIDLTGKPLFQRGYRIFTGEAPINEVLACGLLKLANWNPSQLLVDAMCGSGTFLIEAALIALNRPPQMLRTKFALMHYTDFNRRLWQSVRKEADQKINNIEPALLGMDNNGQVLRMARKNAVGIDIQMIDWKKKDFFSWRPESNSGMLIMNPPYDERLPIPNAVDFYRQIGDHLKQEFTGWQAWIVSAHLEGLKHIGLKPNHKYKVFNGPLESQFVGFDLY